MLKDILEDYLFLLVIFAGFLILIVTFLLLISKKKISKKIYLYGLLMELKPREILALSLILVNFIFLVYVLVTKLELSLAILIVSTLLIIISFSCLLKFKDLLINLVINFVNIGLIYLANLINVLRIESPSVTYYILQIVMNVFGILFYIFTSIKFIKNIRSKGVEHGKV